MLRYRSARSNVSPDDVLRVGPVPDPIGDIRVHPPDQWLRIGQRIPLNITGAYARP